MPTEEEWDEARALEILNEDVKDSQITLLKGLLDKARAFLVIDQLAPAVHSFEIEKRVAFRKALIAEIDAALPRS